MAARVWPWNSSQRAISQLIDRSSFLIPQIDKAPFEEELEEKRVVLTADFTGHVLSASRPGAELFGFANSSLVGASLCDFIDIFGEWRERNGESQLQLLLLALLDKEQEMPGEGRGKTGSQLCAMLGFNVWRRFKGSR